MCGATFIGMLLLSAAWGYSSKAENLSGIDKRFSLALSWTCGLAGLLCLFTRHLWPSVVALIAMIAQMCFDGLFKNRDFQMPKIAFVAFLFIFVAVIDFDQEYPIVRAEGPKLVYERYWGLIEKEYDLRFTDDGKWMVMIEREWQEWNPPSNDDMDSSFESQAQ